MGDASLDISPTCHLQYLSPQLLNVFGQIVVLRLHCGEDIARATSSPQCTRSLLRTLQDYNQQ
jgi:hypothetical protein